MVLSASYVSAASFDCSKASNFAEESVCSNTDLSRLDEALSRVYRIALERTTDKEKLRAEQQKWLEKRDACNYEKVTDNYERTRKQKDCLQHLYNSRVKELNAVLYARVGTGRYRCTPGRGVNFVIADGIITDFNAVTSVSGSEFAVGYTLTCVQHIANFYQTAGGKKYVLQFYPSQDQYGESSDCQVHIEDLDTRFRVRTSNCRSECMRFDLEIKKNACYQGP